MGKYNYSINKTEDVAHGVGRDLSISLKHALEICSYIRGKNIVRVKAFLGNVVKKKEAVPFRKFNGDVGHKPGLGAARYPVKAADAFLKLIGSIEANAKEKGMDQSALYISHTLANKASRPMRYGRHSRRESKRTHVEIALKENPALVKNQKPKTKKTQKKTVKTEQKPENAQSTENKEEKSQKTTPKSQKTTEPSKGSAKKSPDKDSTEENKK